MSFMRVWIDAEGIMLSDISQKKTNTIGSYLYVKYRKQNKIIDKRTVNGCQRLEDRGMGQMGEVGTKGINFQL